MSAAAQPAAGPGAVWGELIQGGVASLAAGWWEPEVSPEGDWFAWGGAGAEISLPQFPRGTKLEVDLMPARGPASLTVELNGKKVREVKGTSHRDRLWVSEEFLNNDSMNALAFQRSQGYVPSAADLRPLAVQFFGLRAVGMGVAWSGMLTSEEERQRCFVRSSGLLDPEAFPQGPGVWTHPEAQLWAPAGPGTLTLRMWASRPQPPRLEILARGKSLITDLEVGHDPMEVDLPITAVHVAKGGVELELRATPFCPAREGLGDDARELGVVLSHARFVPKS
jgi:hypothetical protein